MKLDGIEDIIDMKPLMRDPRHFFICTTEGLHILEVNIIRNSILSCKLLPSDNGHAPLSTFPFHDEVVRGAVEIARNQILVAVEERSRLYVIDACTRMAIKLIINPTMLTSHLTLIAAPGYDPETFPYVFLKNSRFISVVNTKEFRMLPLLRAANDCVMNRNHYLDLVSEVRKEGT
jgi:hypothetical protein